MTSNQSSGNPFRAGEWLVRPSECALIRGTDVIHVEPRTMQVLCALAEANGEVLSADDLLVKVWKGTFYGDSPLHKAIAQLRKAVGDDSRDSRFVETVRKRGYRLVPPVQFADGSSASPAERSTWNSGSPFRGLEEFGVAHAAVFFGRKRLVEKVLGALDRQRQRGVAFVLCVGPSGVGKSSLLKAGVLPELLQRGGRSGWQSVAHAELVVGEGSAIDALAGALCALRVDGEPVFHATETTAIRADLRAHPQRLIDSAGHRLRSRRPRDSSHCGFVLVADELDQLMRDPVDVEPFIAALSALSRSPIFAILAACRSSEYHRISTAPALIELKGSEGHVDIEPPGAGELAEIVRGPAQLAGLRYALDPLGRERLDDVILEAAIGQPECLPMLQHLLDALYESRSGDGELTFQAYRDIGGLSGALSRHAENVFEGLDEAQRKALPTLLSKMVDAAEESSVVRSLPVSLERMGPGEIELVDVFVAERLFVVSCSTSETVVRTAHDALLRHWPRAVDWIQRNRALLALQGRLKLAANRWNQRGRPTDLLLTRGLPLEEGKTLQRERLHDGSSLVDEFINASRRRHQRFLHLRNAGIAVLVVLAFSTSLAAWFAIRERTIAQRQRNDAEHLVDFMLDDLFRQLQPLGKISLLDGVVDAADRYLSASDKLTTSTSLRFWAETQLRLGEIKLQQGRDGEALKKFTQARSLLEDLRTRQPLDVDVLRQLGNAAYWQGFVHYRARQVELARESWNSYARVTEDWLKHDNASIDATLERSYALNNLGVLDRDDGRFEAAAASFEKSIQLKREVLDRKPDDRSILADLADSESWRASSLASVGRMSEARSSLMQALERIRRGATLAPEEIVWKHREATIRMNLGLLDFDRGDLVAADVELGIADGLLDTLSSHDPDNANWARDRLFVQQQRAWLKFMSGSPSSVLDSLAEVEEKLKALSAKNPGNHEWRMLESQILGRMAVADVARGGDKAMSLAERALERLGPIPPAGEPGGDRSVRYELRLVVSDIRARQEGRQASIASWQQTLDELNAIAPSTDDIQVLDIRVRLLKRLGKRTDAEVGRKYLASVGFDRPSYDSIISILEDVQ